MTDTLYTDTSEFQRCAYNDAYPYRAAAFRSNDGTYRDRKFVANHAWAKTAANTGRIDLFVVYFVWRPNWQQTVATLKAMVGTPHPKMAVMIDVESWGGQIRGNQSTGINAAREAVIKWLGGNRKRVIGYGNAGDLANLWPTRGDAQIVLANYSANPASPRHIAHQFTSSANVTPFGKPVDLNSADGLSPAAFAAALGLTATPTPEKPVALTKTDLVTLLHTDNVLPAPNDSDTKANPYWAWQSHITTTTQTVRANARALADLQQRFVTQEASLQTAIEQLGAVTDLLNKVLAGQVAVAPINVTLSGSLHSVAGGQQ